MSRARMQRNKARAQARIQMATAVATTGRPPMDHGSDTPIWAALAAVIPVTPYDDRDAEFAAWPGYPPPAPARPASAMPAWVMDTAAMYRVDAAIQSLGGGTRPRALTVRALATVRDMARTAGPAPAAMRAPVDPITALPAPIAAVREFRLLTGGVPAGRSLFPSRRPARARHAA